MKKINLHKICLSNKEGKIKGNLMFFSLFLSLSFSLPFTRTVTLSLSLSFYTYFKKLENLKKDHVISSFPSISSRGIRLRERKKRRRRRKRRNEAGSEERRVSNALMYQDKKSKAIPVKFKDFSGDPSSNAFLFLTVIHFFFLQKISFLFLCLV